jgi:hypothetical protein
MIPKALQDRDSSIHSVTLDDIPFEAISTVNFEFPPRYDKYVLILFFCRLLLHLLTTD